MQLATITTVLLLEKFEAFFYYDGQNNIDEGRLEQFCWITAEGKCNKYHWIISIPAAIVH